MRLEWEARAAEHGLGRRELKRLLGRTVLREFDEHEVAEVAARLAGPDGLTGTRSTFTGTDAVMAWAQAQVQGAPTERVLSLVERFLAMEQVAPIVPATIGRPASFSTTELLRHEREALRLAAPGRRVSVPTVSPAMVEQVANERQPALSREQLEMVHAAASSPERVVCVVGEAGAGKTTALAALADAYRRDGHVAIGAAPSGVAAANLAAETGMPSGTLHHLLAQARQQGGLPRGCLLVVDEAAMADTRTLTRALFEVEHAEGKAVLVGDPAQLPAVGPGGLFSAIVERNGAIELHDNRRQRDELERRALALLREGGSRDYLAHAAQHGRLTVSSDRVEAKAQLVADWWQAARGDLAGSAMIAYRRADVAELNTVARTLLDHEGRLGRDRLRLDSGIELAVGDRILCTRNDRRLEVANGSRGTITAVDREQQAIEVELDDQRRLTLPARYLDAGHVAHAYALTGHKTQGLTVERAFVLADDRRALREWGYVALSRAREQTRLYTTANELEPDAPPHRPEPAEPARPARRRAHPASRRDARDRRHDDATRTNRARRARQAEPPTHRSTTGTREGTPRHHPTPEPDGPAGSPASACSAAPATAAPSATRSTNTTRNSRASTASSTGSTNSSAGRESAPSSSPRLNHGPSEASAGSARSGARSSGVSTAASSCESHVHADVARDPQRPLHPELDLHDPPQLTRPLHRQLPQPLRLTTRLTAELVRVRSRHPRKIRNRRHPHPQPRTDVLHRRATAQIIEAPPRPRRLGNHVQLPHRGAQPQDRLGPQ